MFKIWSNNLDKTGYVTQLLNTRISSIDKINGKLRLIATDNKYIYGDNIIFAIPPQPMFRILSNSFDRNLFGDFATLSKWEVESRYLVYIPIIFHWNEKLKLEKIWGATETEYGLVYVIMSDYMNFNDPRSKTVIVCTVKNSNNPSKVTGKTANECNENELIAEVFRQLKTIRVSLPSPQFSILDPGVFKNGDKWDTIDTAYFYTKARFVPDKSVIFSNLRWIGTHSGFSDYSFTSMESAMQNAVHLLHEILPETRKDIRIYEPFTVKKMLWIVVIVIVIMVVCKMKK